MDWAPLGSGVDAEVRAMAVFNGQLVVGGKFTSAGGKSASYVAIWSKPVDTDALLGDVNCDAVIDLADVVLLGNFLDGLVDESTTCLECAGDVDIDGDVDESDYSQLYDLISHL